MNISDSDHSPAVIQADLSQRCFKGHTENTHTHTHTHTQRERERERESESERCYSVQRLCVRSRRTFSALLLPFNLKIIFHGASPQAQFSNQPVICSLDNEAPLEIKQNYVKS